MGEMVTTTDKFGGSGTAVVRGEGRVDVCGSLCCFDDHEAGAAVVCGLEVDVWLVVGDIEALDC